MTWRGLAGVLAATLLAVSCGGDDDTAASVAESAPETTAESSDGSVVASTQPAPEPVESSAPESTAPPEDLPAEPILQVPDAPVIVQTTPTSGGGTRPLLSWEPVDDASTYLVIVFADGDAPYWSTITGQTEIYVGGAAAIPEGVDGPEVSEGYSWAVYAEDENGAPIASSPIRPISP